MSAHLAEPEDGLAYVARKMAEASAMDQDGPWDPALDSEMDAAPARQDPCPMRLHLTLPVRKMPAERERLVNELSWSSEAWDRILGERTVETGADIDAMPENEQTALSALASSVAHRNAMKLADLFYATPDFTRLLEGAWQSVPLDGMIVVPPVTRGWVYLAEPVEVPTEHFSKPLLARIITWSVERGPGGRGSIVLLWVDAYDQRWQIGRSEMARVECKPGTSGDRDEDWHVVGTQAVGRIGLAALHLLQQDNLVESEVRASPPAVARKASRKRGNAPSPVKVVRLRKSVRENVNAAHEASQHSQTVRYVVRGHWRNQACGRGRSDRRRIYIEPHYRGPEDAALVVRPTVFQW